MPRRSTLAIAGGSLVLLLGVLLTLGPLVQGWRWQQSAEASRAARNAAAPTIVLAAATLTPTIRELVAPATPGVAAGAGDVTLPSATSAPAAVPAGDESSPTGLPGAQPIPGRADAAHDNGSTALPAEPVVGRTDATQTSVGVEAPPSTPTLGPAELKLADVAFQFVDPPQPGASVRLSLAVHNPTDEPAQPISLELPQVWLDGYSIRSIEPSPIAGGLSGQRPKGTLQLTFDGPAAHEDVNVVVGLVTTDEVIDAPLVRLVDAQGREIGRAQPPTVAPSAEPGPVYAIDIPALHLHAGVVPVDWEPPLFVVGQLRDSAYVTEGNSVLVGHLRGAAGYNVFDHLQQLHVGDQVIASSRGVSYPFVVRASLVLPPDDTSPTLPTHTPRLTLMTCAGDWNPLSGEYSERLWVIAEPTGSAADGEMSIGEGSSASLALPGSGH